MSKYPSPTGNIKKFKGNVLNFHTNPFGFFYVNIKTPENWHIPILQTRVKIKNGYTTMSPLGNWSGLYFSEELKKAIEFFNIKKI